MGVEGAATGWDRQGFQLGPKVEMKEEYEMIGNSYLTPRNLQKFSPKESRKGCENRGRDMWERQEHMAFEHSAP